MSAENLYYKHSGTLGPLDPISMAFFDLPVAGVLGALYGLAIFYVPFIYPNIVLTAVAGSMR